MGFTLINIKEITSVDSSGILKQEIEKKLGRGYSERKEETKSD